MSPVSNVWQEQECSCRREERPHSPFFRESRWYLRLLLHAERVQSPSTRFSRKNLLRVPGVTHWSVLFSTAWDSTHLCKAQIARVFFTAALGAIRGRISACKCRVRAHGFVCMYSSTFLSHRSGFPCRRRSSLSYLSVGCIYCSNSRFLGCHMFVRAGNPAGALARSKVTAYFGCDRKVSL